MAQTFSLGPVTFTGFEVTEKLKLPRKTAMSTHEIPQTDDTAAEKIGQTFGTYPEPITLEGTYLGTNADDQIRALEAIQDAQQVVPFTSGPRVFDVLIAEFEGEYVSIGEVNFTVTLEPLLERRAGSGSPAPDAGSQLTSSLNAASSIYDIVPTGLDPSVYSNIKIVQQKQAATPSLTLADVATQIDFAQSVYNAIQSLQTALNTLRQTSGVSNEIQTLESLNGYLSSAYRTLQTYTGQSAISPTIRVPTNTTAYAVAAQYTGDWSNFDAIMKANGLKDPMIAGGTTLTIPRV